jgi:hypothetical protein
MTKEMRKKNVFLDPVFHLMFLETGKKQAFCVNNIFLPVFAKKETVFTDMKK